MRLFVVCILFLSQLILHPVLAQQARRNDVGIIEVVGGKVQIESDVRSNPPAQVGETLYEGEMITTGADGELHMHLADGGYIAIRPNTMLRFTRYQANGDAEDRALFTLVKGSTRFISGWIAQSNPKAWQIKTPTGVVTVRGTDHETWVIPEFDAGGDGGTYDRVYQGRTVLTSRAGSIEIGPDSAGYAPVKERPRILERIPGFYRPGRYDDSFDGKHERLQAALTENRVNRIEKLRSVFRDRQLPAADIKDKPRGVYVPPVGATLPRIEPIIVQSSVKPGLPNAAGAKAECKTVVTKDKKGRKQTQKVCSKPSPLSSKAAAKSTTKQSGKTSSQLSKPVGKTATKNSAKPVAKTANNSGKSGAKKAPAKVTKTTTQKASGKNSQAASNKKK